MTALEIGKYYHSSTHGKELQLKLLPIRDLLLTRNCYLQGPAVHQKSLLIETYTLLFIFRSSSPTTHKSCSLQQLLQTKKRTNIYNRRIATYSRGLHIDRNSYSVTHIKELPQSYIQTRINPVLHIGKNHLSATDSQKSLQYYI